MIKDDKLFIALEITPRLQENLDNCKKAMEIYFKNDNPEYLTIRRIGNKDFIGKAVPDSFPCTSVDNVYRNVISLIKLVVPTFRLQKDAVTIHILSDPLY
jgi:hypothetical protein